MMKGLVTLFSFLLLISSSMSLSFPSDDDFSVFPRAMDKEAENRERLKKVFGERKRRTNVETNDDSVSHRKRQSGSLTFNLHQFSGEFNSFLWNSEDINEVLIHIGNTVYVSENKGANFTDVSGLLEDFNSYYPKIWGPSSGGYGVRSALRSPTENNIIILLGKSNHFWISKDGGNTFSKTVTTRSNGTPLYFQDITFNPRVDHNLMGTHIDSHCLDDFKNATEPICSIELYMSTNYGRTWSLVSTHVRTAYWGMRGTLDNYKEAIYYTTNFAKDSDQFTSNSNGITGFIAGRKILISYDVGQGVGFEIHPYVNQLVVNDLYIYVQSETPSGSSYIYKVEVSYGGLPFQVTHFNGYDLRRYTFMEFSESTVVVMDSPSVQSVTYDDFQGDAWFSDPSGVYFVRSIRKVVQVNNGQSSNYDFHKIKSLEGTYMANSVGNLGNLRTRISWNRGGTWNNVQTLEGLSGLIDETQYPFLLYGELHSTLSGSHNGFHSQQSAPGSVIAIGKHGINFVDYITGKVVDGDVYYSRNGGRIFTKIRSGKHFCKLMDEGSIIVCASGEQSGTQKIVYTLDSGVTWKEETFIDTPVEISWIYSDPESFGLAVIIEAIQDDKVLLVSVDLNDLGLPDCTSKDYEYWYPSDSTSSGRLCILGHRTTYIRPSSTSVCISKLDSYIVDQVNCPCSDEDYSCSYGYFYNNTGKVCSPENGVVDQIVCQDGYYMKDLHYRKTPGNTCNKTLTGSVDLEAPVKTTCPVTDLIDTKNKAQALAIGLGLGLTFAFIIIVAAIIFVIWSKRKGYLHYRLVNNQDAGTDANAMNTFDGIQDGGNEPNN